MKYFCYIIIFLLFIYFFYIAGLIACACTRQGAESILLVIDLSARSGEAFHLAFSRDVTAIRDVPTLS